MQATGFEKSLNDEITVSKKSAAKFNRLNDFCPCWPLPSRCLSVLGGMIIVKHRCLSMLGKNCRVRQVFVRAISRCYSLKKRGLSTLSCIVICQTGFCPGKVRVCPRPRQDFPCFGQSHCQALVCAAKRCLSVL